MPPEKWAPGPTGDRVAANLSQLRGPVSLEELADRLDRLGRRIAPDSIRNVEQLGATRRRRVDVDDLVALSIALGVNPNRLLLPPTSGVQEGVRLTSQVEIPANLAWAWAQGDVPIEPWAPGAVPDGASPALDLNDFRKRARPQDSSPATHQAALTPRALSAAAEITRVLAEQAEQVDMDPLVLLEIVESLARHPANPRINRPAKSTRSDGGDGDG
jgi:hypothetical protein